MEGEEAEAATFRPRRKGCCKTSVMLSGVRMDAGTRGPPPRPENNLSLSVIIIIIIIIIIPL